MSDIAQQKLTEHGYDEKGISAFTKARTYLTINMQTLTDKAPSNISEMMLAGSSMCVIDAIKNIKTCSHAEADIWDLMKRLLKTEENNIEALKKYL